MQLPARLEITRGVPPIWVCAGNVETWRGAISSDSILRWHFRSFARKRARMRAWAAEPLLPATILLRSPAETEHWICTLADI